MQRKFENTFHHGLILKLPNSGTRFIGACEYHDDPKITIEGRMLRRWHCAADERNTEQPNKTEELPIGTQVQLWDEDNGNPTLGTIL